MFGTLVRRIANVIGVVKSVLENLYVRRDGEYISIVDALLGKGDCDKCRELDSGTNTEGDDYSEWRDY